MPRRIFLAALTLASPAVAQTEQAESNGLIFRASLDADFRAERAGGDALPNFRSGVAIVPDGAIGGAAQWADDGYVAWNAPGNMLAARGTLGFFWRARTPVGDAPFVIFRTGFADHSSWDMAFLRIDWNGHGFDAFVTDANLARVRVSWRMAERPAPDRWLHIAFAWDETTGVQLFVDGRAVARVDRAADLDAGLDQFGLAARIISPHQVQSRYNFTRGSDIDELRVYDRMLSPAAVATLAAKGEPPALPPVDRASRERAWLHRYGWDRTRPPLLDTAVTRVRKVEFADARDLKQWMWKGVDGIAETTWPGVYNRSRLPGRSDYFDLPDWNTYVERGRAYALSVPAGERFNRVEIRGAAYGALDWSADGTRFAKLDERPRGVVRSLTEMGARTGGMLRFTNTVPEQPIQEIWAYDIGAGVEPRGSFALSYTVNASAAPTLAALDTLNAHIAGRFAPEERTTVLALPSGGVRAAIGAGTAGATGAVERAGGSAPIVHILIPSNLNQAAPDQPLARAFNYGWRNLHDGLDGIAIDLPAIKSAGRGPIPLNIRVRDPLWPGRDMIDLSVSVRPGEARTLWLDLRDRILPDDSLWLTIASALPGFGAASLDGAKIRLVFKPRADARAEHVADRFAQVKDNWGFLVEEHTSSERAGLYRRVRGDIADLLRVDPDNVRARAYWADIDYRPENLPKVALPAIPAGVPAWAARQVQDLALTRDYIGWWIDHRQVPYGDFGGGLSDDSDLVQQWPALALMGVEPDKVNASLRAVDEAIYRNGMMTDGLGTLTTDELHAYEEGMNADAARLYLNWGEPRTVERLMATTRALGRVVLPNPAGHLHFASNWYGAHKMYREGAWEWQKPLSFTVMHGPIVLAQFNGAPAARSLVTGSVDGWLAHGKQGADGLWTYPTDVNWRTDATRNGDGGGATIPLQSAWAAWRFTGDATYLRPVQGRAARGASVLAEMNENPLVVPQIAPLAGKLDGDLGRWAAWERSGDPAPLVQLHEAAIADKTARMDMVTEGHWWSDRVESETQWLQRERLGGVALRRNQTWPGHSVSWRFAEPGAATQVAILVPGATRERFRVIAYNMTDRAQAADMTTWNVAPGSWTMRSGTSVDAGRTVTADGAPRSLTLERGVSTAVTFAPRTTTVLEFALVTPGTAVEDRPDLGIGSDDVVVKGGRASVTVHSLGLREAAGGHVVALAADGRELARTAVPTLAAPIDLLPRTAIVLVPLPRGAVAVRVGLAGDAAEVTQANNRVALPR